MTSYVDDHIMVDENTHRTLQLAWFAGFYEGEGSIILVPSKKHTATYLRLSIGSTDEDVLGMVQLLFGGTTRGPFATTTPSGGQGKPIYHWTLTRTEEVRTLAEEILPLLGDRRSADIRHCLAHQEYATRPTPAERFWRLVDKTASCWLWTAHRDAYGFGTWQPVKGQRVQAHRWATEALDGSVSPRLANICGNKHCVRPDHWRTDKKVAV